MSSFSSTGGGPPGKPKGGRRPGSDGALSFLTEALPEDPNAKSAQVAKSAPGHPESKRIALVKQAGVRAEQQAAARQTMLDLAQELLEGARERDEFEQLLAEERARCEMLEKALNDTVAREKSALDRLKDTRCEVFRHRFDEAVFDGGLTQIMLLWSRKAVPVEALDAQAAPGTACGKGDGLMLRWMFRAWRFFSREAPRHKEEAPVPTVVVQQNTAEIDKLRERYEGLLAEERAKVRAGDKRVKMLTEELEKLKLVVEQLEREKSELMKQARPKTPEDLGLEELTRKYEEALAVLEKTEATLAEMRAKVAELEARLIQEREEADREMAKMKAQIRDLSAELQRQILFAKHLRDLASKAKRDAAGGISAEKFAQLIAELELMRDKLAILGAERNRELQQAALLRMKLETNKRRMELERQFLPFLHKVQGPVGPKNPLFDKNMQALSVAAMVPDQIGQPQDKFRTAHSQSAGALLNGTAGTRPLGHRATRTAGRP